MHFFSVIQDDKKGGFLAEKAALYDKCIYHFAWGEARLVLRV
jgi:hypothetical protein